MVFFQAFTKNIGHKTKVFSAVVASLAFCAIPLYIERDVKPGHEIFSSEKPQVVSVHEDRMAAERTKKHID